MRQKLRAVLIAHLLAVLAFSHSPTTLARDIATEISGLAHVIDGDTIRVRNVVIRLQGIDAPELAQKCRRANGDKWSCGKSSATALKGFIGQQVVKCFGHGMDVHDRLIATCFVNETDLGKELVASGLAVAFRKYSETYSDLETATRNLRRGMWATDFELPARYRAKRWEVAAQTAPDPNCPIKGNINRKDVRIYHTPWSRMYSRTKISPNKGERWFCTEGEAIAAGWRAPLYD